MQQRFSDRIGVTTAPSTLQVEGMTLALTHSLWNFVLTLLEAQGSDRYSRWEPIIQSIAVSFLKFPLDKVPLYRYDTGRDWLRRWYYERLPWHARYNLIEFIVQTAPQIEGFPYDAPDLERAANEILTEELSAYRFVRGQLVPISNETEVAAIDAAAGDALKAGLEGVHTHLTTALEHLGKKPRPDYRNSIKAERSAP